MARKRSRLPRAVVTFNPLTQNQRAGLALVNGVVYIAYASHGDNPTYYGWIVGYSASSLAQVSLFNDDPGSGYGGIWMSGGATCGGFKQQFVCHHGKRKFRRQHAIRGQLFEIVHR